MSMAEKQTCKPMEYNGRASNKPTQLQPSDFFQRKAKHVLEKRESFQQIVLGKLDIHM
jgi:hypothetical protein